MSRVALFTFGILVAPYSSNEVAGLFARGDDVVQAARTTEGFMGVAEVSTWDPVKSPFEQDYGDWGEIVIPRFYQGPKDNEARVMQTLSTWTHLEGAAQFAYGGFHAEVLSRRREYFVKPDWPTYVLWWVDDDRIPTWQAGCERLEYLHDNGPSSFAFNFKNSFDAQGRSVPLKRLSSHQS